MKYKKGFSLIEIILAISILAVVFSFLFYFLSTIYINKNKKEDSPYLLKEYDYSGKFCNIKDNLENISIHKDTDLSRYISTSTPITSMNIFHKNLLIITVNSASTTEADILLFDIYLEGNIFRLNPRDYMDTGPGINDALLIDNYLYALNTSVNSHVQTFFINNENNLLNIGDTYISELSQSYSIPKKIYLFNNRLIVGAEKNNLGGELVISDLLIDRNTPIFHGLSAEIGGQVNDIYGDRNILYVTTAQDIELFIFDENFSIINSYDAPLSLGNGKSVYHLYPYIFLGRTIASFELNILDFKNNIINLINKYKFSGTIDFIISTGKSMLFINNNSMKELQFMSSDFSFSKSINLPSRVTAYTCIDDNLLVSNIINNQSHILWIQ